MRLWHSFILYKKQSFVFLGDYILLVNFFTEISIVNFQVI